jgi:hypothetical protein
LHLGNYRITSPPDRFYNCIAWAAGRSDQWWDPVQPDVEDPDKRYYWPAGFPRDDKVATLIMVYALVGFIACGTDGSREKGVEKIAIFAHGNFYEHAALQLENGRWTSKIGLGEDIEHDAPENLVGPCYGQIATFLKRRIPYRFFYLFPLGRPAFIR